MKNRKKTTEEPIALNPINTVGNIDFPLIDPEQTIVIKYDALSNLMIGVVSHFLSQSTNRPGDKEILTTDEVIDFLNNEIGFSITKASLHSYICMDRNKDKYKRGQFFRFSKPIPYSRIGGRLQFETNAIREWALSEIKNARTTIPS